MITPCARWRLARVVVYHDLRVQSGIVTRDDRRIDVAFSSRCTSSRHSGVVARHPSGWGTSLLEGIFPLNEPIRARLFLLAPRPKSRRHHINKGWAWFEARLPESTSTQRPTITRWILIHSIVNSLLSGHSKINSLFFQLRGSEEEKTCRIADEDEKLVRDVSPSQSEEAPERAKRLWPISFSSDKDRRTDSRSFTRSSRCGFVAQWLERATRIRKILGSILGGAALCFFVWSGRQFFYLCRSWKRREFEKDLGFFIDTLLTWVRGLPRSTAAAINLLYNTQKSRYLEFRRANAP